MYTYQGPRNQLFSGVLAVFGFWARVASRSQVEFYILYSVQERVFFDARFFPCPQDPLMAVRPCSLILGESERSSLVCGKNDHFLTSPDKIKSAHSRFVSLFSYGFWCPSVK